MFNPALDFGDIGYETADVQTANVPIPGFGFTGITYSPSLDLFVAVATGGGANQRIYTSPDGEAWTQRTSALAAMTDSALNDVIWVEELGLFVCIGTNVNNANGTVQTSSDGVNWVQQSGGQIGQWDGIAYSPQLGLLVAVGFNASNKCMTSPDGVTWTLQTIGNRSWNAVDWSPALGLFCATAFTGGTLDRLATSPDGTTWTLQNAPVTAIWEDIKWSPKLGMFVVVGGDEGNAAATQIITSPDGANWTIVRTQRANGIVHRSVLWCDPPGLFIVTKGSTANNHPAGLDYSRDGVHWTAHDDTTPYYWKASAFSTKRRRHVAVNRLIGSISGWDDDDSIRRTSLRPGRSQARPLVVKGIKTSSGNFATSGSGLGAVDSKKGVLYAFLRSDVLSADARILSGVTTVGGASARFQLRILSGGVHVEGMAANGSTILDLASSSVTSPVPQGGGWVSVLASWDLSTPDSGTLYMNDVWARFVGNYVDADLVFSAINDWGIGARPDSAGGWDGDIAELYLSIGDYLDFKDPYYRRRFVREDGKPADLGADGRRGTGNVPLLYFSARPGDSVADFLTNRGSGGGTFTQQGNAAISIAPTSPSD